MQYIRLSSDPINIRAGSIHRLCRVAVARPAARRGHILWDDVPSNPEPVYYPLGEITDDTELKSFASRSANLRPDA